MKELVNKYRKLAKQFGSTEGRKECKVGVPAHDFDKIVQATNNPSYYIKIGQYDTKGDGYFETFPNTLGRFYNPDIVTFIREN